MPRIISTKEAHERLGLNTVTGIDEWETVKVDTDKVPGLRITGTPCMHGSDEELHRTAGHVLGFILEWDGQEHGVLYISGDTVNKLVPTHQEGWAYFLENRAVSHEQMIVAGWKDKLVWLEAGRPVSLEI